MWVAIHIVHHIISLGQPAFGRPGDGANLDRVNTTVLTLLHRSRMLMR
jgi:hypothetical protein